MKQETHSHEAQIQQQLFVEVAKSTVLIYLVSFPFLWVPAGDVPEKSQQHSEQLCADKTLWSDSKASEAI